MGNFILLAVVIGVGIFVYGNIRAQISTCERRVNRPIIATRKSIEEEEKKLAEISHAKEMPDKPENMHASAVPKNA